MNSFFAKRFTAAAAAIVATGASALAAEKPLAEGTAVGDALRPWLESGELAGAVSVVYDGSTGREQVACMGWADVAAERPVTLDTPFMQCSQTKGFCGVTVAILVEEGVVSLDDPVSKYLPEFKTLWVTQSETNDTRVLVKAKNELTLRMVMNHTGGFPFEVPAKQASVPGGGWSGGMPIRSVAATAAAQPLLFEPGTKTKYSNTGIDIGAAVVQTVTGMPWDRFLKERVLDPLGMTETRFKPTPEQIAEHFEMYKCNKDAPATFHLQSDWEQRPYDGDHVFPSAGAGLWTTARDQLKFYRMIMNGGIGDNGVRILKEETVRNVLATSSRPEGMGGYSLGLNVTKDGWVGHGGAFGTNCMVDIEKKRLKLWVVQLAGNPRPWDAARDKAVDAFFSEALDNAGSDAYTGRVD